MADLGPQTEVGVPPPPLVADGDAYENGAGDAQPELPVPFEDAAQAKPKLKLKIRGLKGIPKYRTTGRNVMKAPFTFPLEARPAPATATADSTPSTPIRLPIAHQDPREDLKIASPAPVLTVPPPVSAHALDAAYALTNSAPESIITEAPSTTRKGRHKKAKKKAAPGELLVSHQSDDMEDTMMGEDDDDAAFLYQGQHRGAEKKEKRNASEPLKEGDYTPPYSSGEEVPPAMNYAGSSNPKDFAIATCFPEIQRFPQVPIHEPPICPVQFDEDTITLFTTLSEATVKSGVQAELPGIFDHSNNEIRWTAKQMMSLYLYCYRQEEFNFCDMIADTWIRAFHKANYDADKKFAERHPGRHGEDKNRPWIKRSLVSKNKNMYQGQGEKQLPKDYFQVKEIKLDKSVTSLRPAVDAKGKAGVANSGTMIECVNTLYNATPRTCPARLLWADILALHGAPVDRLLNNPRHTSGKPKADVSGNRESNGALHPDLVWDVMSTSLRMVRRNLTLVCEMTTEGAWCERYHLHAKMGHNCYQELHKEDQERLEMEREKLDAKLAETADADRMDVDAEEYSEEE